MPRKKFHLGCASLLLCLSDASCLLYHLFNYLAYDLKKFLHAFPTCSYNYSPFPWFESFSLNSINLVLNVCCDPFKGQPLLLRSYVSATVSSLRVALPTESKKEEAGLEKGPDTPSPTGLRLRLYGEFRTQSRYFMQAKTYHG